MLVIKIQVDDATTVTVSFKTKPKDRAVRIAILDETGKEITQMDNITVGNKRVLTAKPVNAHDQARPIDTSGPITWEASAQGIVSLFPSDTGVTCEVVGINPGTVTITPKADADLGPGVIMIQGTTDLTVILDLATKINVDVGPEIPF